MAVGSAARRLERTPRVAEVFGAEASQALDLLEVLEKAWHDVYGDVTFPDGVFDDLLVTSGGRLDRLIEMVRLAVIDWRDLRVAADAVRNDD